jgi:hypothetical protein
MLIKKYDASALAFAVNRRARLSSTARVAFLTDLSERLANRVQLSSDALAACAGLFHMKSSACGALIRQ